MKDTIETMQHALDALLDEGVALFRGASQGHHGDHPLTFITKHALYQSWYTKALRVIRQLYPELSEHFQAHYRPVTDTSGNPITETVQDALASEYGMRLTATEAA